MSSYRAIGVPSVPGAHTWSLQANLSPKPQGIKEKPRVQMERIGNARVSRKVPEIKEETKVELKPNNRRSTKKSSARTNKRRNFLFGGQQDKNINRPAAKRLETRAEAAEREIVGFEKSANKGAKLDITRLFL